MTCEVVIPINAAPTNSQREAERRTRERAVVVLVSQVIVCCRRLTFEWVRFGGLPSTSYVFVARLCAYFCQW